MSNSNSSQLLTPAEEEFRRSSIYPYPPEYEPWKIHLPPLNAPSSVQSPQEDDAPWLEFNFETEPEKYIMCVRDYCFKGMKENDFNPWKNHDRAWYHAPWLHPGSGGREPLHGLRSGRYVPPHELSATQQRTIQSWASCFYNSAGATIFTEMWKNPNRPDWTTDIHFPKGTAWFEVIYTDATNEELPNLEGSPAVEAMIAVQPDDPAVEPDPRNRLTDKPAVVRLYQMDIVVKDDRAQPAGWVFGTFTYDRNAGQGYDGVIPVGLTWGLDPEVNQEAYENGARVKQTWINPAADSLRASLHGYRPFWGWNGRLAGAGDPFIAACQACHSRAQWNPKTMTPGVQMFPPEAVQDGYGHFVPVNDKVTMTWFDNIPGGTPVTEGAISADYAPQLMIGYENYVAWRAKHPE